VAKLTVGENEELMQHPFQHSSVDLNGFHIIFWNANAKLHLTEGFTLSQGDLDWLEADLASTDLPSIITTHIPLDNGSMKGNFYFEKAYPQHAHYPERQAEDVREVIERSGKVILCLNGHAHWNAYHAIDGVHYVTLPSLTESFTTWPSANEAFASVKIGESIEIEVLGKTPMLYRLPINAPGQHWVNIHKDYSPSSIRPA
jgi:Icc protein